MPNGDFHFNPKARRFSWCQTAGCPLGPDTEHFPDEPTGAAWLISGLWGKVNAGEKLSSAEKTLFSMFAQSAEDITWVALNGNFQQWKNLFYYPLPHNSGNLRFALQKDWSSKGREYYSILARGGMSFAEAEYSSDLMNEIILRDPYTAIVYFGQLPNILDRTLDALAADIYSVEERKSQLQLTWSSLARRRDFTPEHLERYNTIASSLGVQNRYWQDVERLR